MAGQQAAQKQSPPLASVIEPQSHQGARPLQNPLVASAGIKLTSMDLTSQQQALCFHILAESPSIISVFSDSPDGKLVYQNVKSLEYHGDLSKAETDENTPSTFLHILNSLLSFEPTDEINLGSVLSDLAFTGSWIGSIKVPQHVGVDPPVVKAGSIISPSIEKRGTSRIFPNRIDENSDYLGGADPLASTGLDIDQVSVFSASFRKAPTRVKSLVLPSFQSMLSSSTGSGRSTLKTGGSATRDSNKDAALSRSATFDGRQAIASSSTLLPVKEDVSVAKAVLDDKMPQLIQSEALRPPRVPSAGVDSLFGFLDDFTEADHRMGIISAFASVNKSNPSGAPYQWHDLSIKKLKHPVTGEPLILVTQNDVTFRVAMERAMVACANTQLTMISTIFPRHVVDFFNQQRNPQRSAHSVEPDIGQLARSHRDVTILFMDIVGFTSMSKEVPPAVVMKFLNDLFGRFDHLLDEHKVQKVETAGDCYIVASGVLAVGSDGSSEVLASHDPHLSASRVLSFAQAMLCHSKMMRMPHNGEPVLIRIGIHTGDCVSGLVGSTLHKFGLFGDTMNTASRMESTSIPGRIQISASTYSMLPQDLREQFEATGGVEVKGKGQMETHLWVETETSLQDALDSSNSTLQLLGSLNQLLGTVSNDPQQTKSPSAAQLASLDIQDITSLTKISGGSQKRPTFEAMTQACHKAVSLLHTLAEKNNGRRSSLLRKIPGSFRFINNAAPGPAGPSPQDEVIISLQPVVKRRPLGRSSTTDDLSISNPPNPKHSTPDC